MTEGRPSSEEIARIYRGVIRGIYLTGVIESPPRLTLVGGQPGAGKSVAIDEIRKELPNSIYLSGDDLRAFYPGMSDLVEKRPLEAPAIMKPVTSMWVRALLQDVRSQNRSLILEGTFDKPDVVAQTITEYSGSGYDVDVVALGVPRHVSLLTALDRPLKERIDTGGGRFTTLAHHDAGFDGTRNFLAHLSSIEGVSSVRVIDRAGTEHFSRVKAEGFGGAADALDRSREPSGANGAAWMSQLHRTTRAAVRAGVVTGEVQTYLSELHRVGIDEVIPTIPLPTYSPMRDALLARTVADLAIVDRGSATPSVDAAVQHRDPGQPSSGASLDR